MSAAPFLLKNARKGFRLGNQQLLDSVISDGLTDAFSSLHMGKCAELCAKKYDLTREMQDEFAARSYRRALGAQADGRLAAEIGPVHLEDPQKMGELVATDEEPQKVKFDKLPKIKPAFADDGTITAGNASSISDGAAALILSSAGRARELGVRPVGRVVSYAGFSQDPIWYTTSPIGAVQRALRKAGWSVTDVDRWEINEAFAVVPMVLMREMKLPDDCVNVRGGAIALGHPIGASGARILVTLITELASSNTTRGVATICIGGGEGLAVCIERPF